MPALYARKSPKRRTARQARNLDTSVAATPASPEVGTLMSRRDGTIWYYLDDEASPQNGQLRSRTMEVRDGEPTVTVDAQPQSVRFEKRLQNHERDTGLRPVRGALVVVERQIFEVQCIAHGPEARVTIQSP
ncbi:MAG TPA: hypothetical protein VLI90_17055, partial [Tepidisphaeraceae bacterium]|nr:hypothetical protein [Tepidisphaeraceae bacterium]